MEGESGEQVGGELESVTVSTAHSAKIIVMQSTGERKITQLNEKGKITLWVSTLNVKKQLAARMSNVSVWSKQMFPSL